MAGSPDKHLNNSEREADATNQGDHSPSWSPDGNDIVFSRSFEIGQPRVYAVDSAGILGEVAYPNARGFEPAWSPDGRRIVYRASPGNALTTVDVVGRATPLGTAGAAPDWQSLNTRPTVRAQRPAAGSTVRDTTPAISAVVGDRETNLAKTNTQFFLDGRARTFSSSSSSTDKLAYASSVLQPGRHTVRIVARDAEGLTATNSWSFKVIR